MSIIKIILGLAGISILIIIHELGHFITAKKCGVQVERFSIGFGKILLKRNIGSTEFAISLIPIGGYCKFKGEQNFLQAMEEKLEYIPKEQGSIFSVSPFKRILIAISGPLFNFLLSLLFLFIVSWMPYTEQSSEPRIVLASKYDHQNWAADKAGLKTADLIVEINGFEIKSYQDISKTIAMSAERKLNFLVERNGELLNLQVIPQLSKKTGSGRLGIYPYFKNKINEDFIVEDRIIIPSGSIITKCNDQPITYFTDLFPLLQTNPEMVTFEIVTAQGETRTIELKWSANYWNNLPIPLNTYSYKNKTLGASLKWTIREFSQFFRLTLKGFTLLFRGLDVVNAMVGPIRAPMLTGEVAISGFQQGVVPGIRYILLFLAPLSLALGVANLLPIPALDGGQIILFLIDWFRKKKITAKFIFNYQMIGSMLVLLLMVLAVSMDIMYFLRGIQ